MTSDTPTTYELMYWVVTTFDRVTNEFAHPGVFTLERDAREFADKLGPLDQQDSPLGPHARYRRLPQPVDVMQISHAQLVEWLLEERLGRLREVLKKLKTKLNAGPTDHTGV